MASQGANSETTDGSGFVEGEGRSKVIRVTNEDMLNQIAGELTKLIPHSLPVNLF